MLQDAQKPAKMFAQAPLGMHCSACWSAILLVALSAVALAQSRSGNLYGVVKGSGRALADVRVRLSREDSSQPVAETVTDASGRFRFAGLTWGSYTLDLAADGWQSRRILIEVRSDSTLYVRTTLSPLVSDQAPAPVEVVDEDVWFGTQFSDLAIQQLPNGRNIWSLLQGQEPSTVTNRFEIADGNCRSRPVFRFRCIVDREPVPVQRPGCNRSLRSRAAPDQPRHRCAFGVPGRHGIETCGVASFG